MGTVQPKKCTTVGELIAELSKCPPDATLIINGADSGGYDIMQEPFGYVWYNYEQNFVHIDLNGDANEVFDTLT